MILSIITPHYNDIDGLKQIHGFLEQQTKPDWEWLIVDDCSGKAIKAKLDQWLKGLKDDRVRLIFNDEKTNASVCRNIGAENSNNQVLVFLDSDDEISNQFVDQRLVEPREFIVYKNFGIKNSKGEINNSNPPSGHHLNYFLSARFIWHTSSLLWNKDFFNSVGKFNPKLPRLQDVELAIRALQASSTYKVVDNEVDFYYNVKPIRSRKNFLEPVCNAVHIFISELLDASALNKQQRQLIKGYCFVCTKYLERSESRKGIDLVNKNLRLFNKLKYINATDYFIGLILLQLYRWRILNGKTFLKFNRYLFKPNDEAIEASEGY